ncbi:MARTX multifunctional-autoprocessing repeats-in-toxin holotoxin RtxA [Xenorhabdus littoralis]|uniref:MARTX multifunctional-autoprocessing repeats-in-toxin holotoxin RtxA n=1 Tax=Xenorhabdus littoralis TaxID=2582835 RepID=UPI0029E7CEC7|nr:MARTX multifunctional-autoprocessing repeats-in-toxin holotoxin RtxA [Xenorhabdus sp. psl]
MGKSASRSTAYAFTGRYEDDNEGNTIYAIGLGGVINAYGGNDNIVVGSIGATVNTTWGNDTITGGAGYLDINDTSGNLTVEAGSGYTSINKTQSGQITFAGVSGGVKINHTGDKSGITYSGAAGYNNITRKGLQGDVIFQGAGAYNKLWHGTNQGNVSFAGAGGANKIDRTWFNRYQDSHGDIEFKGAGIANIISSIVESGNVDFEGAGAGNNIVRKGKIGDVTLRGAGAYNYIERTRQVDDVYAETKGNIRFEGVGGYNSLHSDVAHGDIHFAGAGAYNQITRKGTASDLDSEGMEYAKADEVVLTNATISGSWIGTSHQVFGVKSAREPNTYLFAFEDGTHTKINKVQLSNDPETGKLRYYSTAWFKKGKYLKELDKQDISVKGGFRSVGANGAYTLSNLGVEQRKSVSINGVENKLTENKWGNYGNLLIEAENVILSDAKMSGYYGTTVDVKAVKSNKKPNTYVYVKRYGKHLQATVIELKNDSKTGELQYFAHSWYKEALRGDKTPDFANEIFSPANGYKHMGTGIDSLSDLHYTVNTVRITSARVSDMHEYSDLELFKPATDGGESAGDVHYNGAGGGNVIKSNVTRGNVYFNGAGIANVIEHSSDFGNTEFNGAGGANVIIKKGKEGKLNFNGAGIANVLLNQSQRGDMEVNAGGTANVLVRVGDGRYLAHLLAVGNISIHKGHGDSRVTMLGGYNTHTQIGDGNANWLGAGGFNVMTQKGKGAVSSVLVGGANVLTKLAAGHLVSGMLGGANIITHISGDNEISDTTAIALGGANILTKKGRGDAVAVMGGGTNVLTHIGNGSTQGVMLGGTNILTKVGNGDTTGIMFGLGNVLTHVGNGQTLGVMAAAGNIFTKVGNDTTIAAMIGAGNIFTHVGKGNAWVLMGGAGNIFTKVGNGDALALMLAFGNVFTHVGDGMSVALMIAKGNIATKVGNGDALSAMIGKGNIFTQIGHGSTFAAMIGGANVLTKVGDDLTAALMIGEANIYTHVGKGTSIGLFGGSANIMTKVGDGTTLAAMFGKANIMTHVGNGLTGVLALGKANIVTKVGDDFMGVVAASEANVVTHVGGGTTAALLSGKGNILTKVGNGTTVGLLNSKIGNIMTHVGDGTTVGFAKGEANIITKVGGGLGINAAWGKANVMTHVGNGDRYNFAKGNANIVTKVGDGQEVTVVQGEVNIVTHVGDGDDYTGAWGKGNVITKVGGGSNVVLAKGDANIVTQIGDGDSFNALWSQGNIVTKVGDGIQVTAAKGKGNITTTAGDGLSVTAVHGDLNINTKVGDGVSVNVAWGKFNVNTRVGDGLNVSVMKGKGNANIRVGDGLNINASYARNNVAIQIGNGDFYSLSVAESNTESNKLDALFANIKQTLLGSAGSQGISYLVNGDEANTSGTHKGRGAINLPEVSSLDGFKLTEIDEVTSDLKNSLKGTVSGADDPDTDGIERSLNRNLSRNLIVNGDFEKGAEGWIHTNGIEASHSAKAYGLSVEGHGEHVSELKNSDNTSLYQDIENLMADEKIVVKFDFASANGHINNRLLVQWNGKVVFGAADRNTEWQNKTLTLTAKAGSNRLKFLGIGSIDGVGYVLDNVVATSELSESDIADHVKRDKAAQNALQDKKNAEADRQRLKQEKDKTLAAVSGTQAQLENTDLNALNANGQSQRDAINGEAQAFTDELKAKVKGLDALDSYARHDGKSGEQWQQQFGVGLLENIQTQQLDSAKKTAQQQLEHSRQAAAGRLNEIKDAVAKSESGVLKGEQNHQHAKQDIEAARTQAKNRETEATSYKQRAEQAKLDGEAASQKAEQRGQNEASEADSKTAQVQNDAKNSKLDGSYKPKRTGAAGSGLSGKAYEADYSDDTEKAEQSKSKINPESIVQADGGFSKELRNLDENLNELANAKEALNRLQINAGIRGKATGAKDVGAILTSVYTETPVNQPVNKTDDAPIEFVRNTPRISGLDLSGLQALSETLAQPESADMPETVSAAAIRAQKVADIYRWLNSDNNIATEKYIPVPGFDRVDADIPDDIRQRMVASIEGWLEQSDTKVPKDQFTSLAKLFVDATIDYDWDKRVELVSRLESYDYSFEPVHGDKSIVSFWSGKNFKAYRKVLDAVQTDGKKVVYDVDVQGNNFALNLNKQLQRWSNMLDILNPDISEQERQALQSVISASTRSNTGFWSSLYATGSRDDVYVIAEGGLRLGNYFWNVELPVLRQLQREGLVGEIRLLDKAAKEYDGVSPESIGRRLTEAGIPVKARFDSLSHKEQEKLLELNPEGYRADTLVDVDVKLSAIDSMLNQALPFYGLRTERNLLVRESEDNKGFEVRPWPGHDSDSFKTIIVEDSDDSAQIKAIERFILANYDNYDQLPEALLLVDNRIVSHEQGHTRIIAEKSEGSWSYKPKTDLLSAGELQEAAYVKGKILGDSYRNVLDALKGYENTLQNSNDYDLESVEKLTYLRHQVQGYLLGHPDSARTPALQNLLSQINVRMEESLVLAEPTLKSAGKGNFSDLYNKLGNAKLKDSKHFYIDEQGDFVTRGKSNIQSAMKADSAENAVEQVKAAVSREYGQPMADTVFANLQSRDLSKDGKGIDVSGLRKVHQAIEQQLSPVSATLFVWKPSDHSRLGHAALQIGQGRIQISAEKAEEFNEKNYVSWWPEGSKSSNISDIFDVSSDDNPDVRIRWRDLSQPAIQNKSLGWDVDSEEGDNFGMNDGTIKLEKFIEKLRIAKGVDAKFEDISEGFAMAALANPQLLESAGIPEPIYRPYMKQWEDGSMDMLEVGKNFAQALRTAAKQSPELSEKRITNVIRQFAEHELSNIQDFKASEGDQGRVFRINLAGLDAAAMQAEWHKISQNPDARYQLLTDNCSTIVARVLKAGGADKVIGHTWRPKFGVWTPTELFNFSQKLQEAQIETAAKKQRYSPVEELAALSGKNKTLETVIVENDGTPSLNELITKDGLRKEASVFAKPIGPSYQAILDKLDHIHNLTGNEQLSAGFELYQRITRYLNAHPDSKRNTTLSGVQTQLGDIMFRGALQEVRSPLLEIAQTRPEMALRIYQIARNEARENTPGLTDLMVRWVKEDPYLAAKLGYQGEMPANLAFNPKFHVDLGDQFDDFKQCLSKAQDKGLLIHARIDEQNKRVHLGYSYNELLDMTGSEDVKMAVYFLKEVAKQADPNFAGSYEAILLNRFANPAYLVQLEQDRLAQIEAIYHSSHQTDIAAWDKQYSSDALTQLNRQLSDGQNLSSQLSLLLKDRQGLLIGESHGSDLNGLRFVNEQMDALKAHGVTVIGLEHLRSDLAQPLIDKFLAGGDMPAELTAMIETKHLSINLFEQAKSKGIKIIALDDNSTTRPATEGSQHGLMYRAGAANNVAVKRLGQLAEGEKFVAIYGNAHLKSHEGIDHFVPGMTHRLGLPALKVDANNRFTAQADDISLRKRYDDVPQIEKNLYKPNRVVGEELEALGHSDKKDKALEKVAIDNDGTLPRDSEPFNPVTRFLNDNLYGDKKARRKVDDSTQIILDDAVTKGTTDKVTLQGEAGRLAGYYHNGSQKDQAEQSQEKESAKKVVLFIHGSGSSAEEQASTIQSYYQRQGVDMLAVNMRGYGSSDGHPSEKGLYQDARTMLRYLVNDRGVKPENIIIHGYSMGGAVAADLARYAERNGQPVSGLLLDRPMPSMTKALTAHEVPNPAGITGVLAKAVNGQFSVEKNLQGISKQTPIMLLTDNEGLGKEGEKLRAKLAVAGYQVSGEHTYYGHEASGRLMDQYAEQIVSALSEPQGENRRVKAPLKDTAPEGGSRVVNNQDIESWERVTVKPQSGESDSRFSGQIIIQTENDPVAAKAAASLASKHPDSSVIVQLDANGRYRVVYGDPDKLQSGKLRWQIVGHGRDESAQNHTRMSGYSADELALKLTQFRTDFKQVGIPDRISLVGCSLIGDDKRNGFAHRLISALNEQDIRTTVSARSSEVAVDSIGRKHTKDAQEQWVHKLTDNKIVLGWNDKGEIESHSERVRSGISENDIVLSRVGQNDIDAKAKGAIADNAETFHAPKKRNEEDENKPASSKPAKSSNQHLSYSGKIQLQLGDGEFTAVNWGTTNVGIKVGTGGFKTLAFGDNNVMVHIGNGDSKHSVDIAGYQALEGAQLFVGNRNVSFNMGRSNDLIVMMEKSIPTPPLVNPFDGAARISGVLQNIAGSFNSPDWLTKQDQQWTLESAKKYVSDLSGLDLTSSVDYKTLTDLNSHNERSSRGLKSDLESTVNKKYNQRLSRNGNTPETDNIIQSDQLGQTNKKPASSLSRADKFRQANEKLAFNFAVGGQGADIQVTTGNWNFMFGDNIQSILDTNLGSLFGLMTQQYTLTGIEKTTFTFSPKDLPRQLKNKLLGNLAGVSGDTTLADIFGVDYTPGGGIVSRTNQPVDGVAILREMLEVIGEFSGNQLQAFIDPEKLLNSLKAGVNMGADGVKSFAESHGLKAKAPDEKQEGSISVSVDDKLVVTTEGAQADRAVGLTSLNLPNLFATLFNQDKQAEMKSLVTNLKKNLTADLLNMQDKTFDFLRNSGHLQGDGDVHVSLGNYNFNWGGDGKDLGAYLGDRNNFWGGRGDDVFYSVGTSNIFTGGEGHDLGVMMGRENMMFGDNGNDVAVLAGRINHAYMGEGDDQVFAFGEGGVIDGGKGRDYIVASGNFNHIKAGEDQDYVVTIGNNNQVDLGEGDDFATVFGNDNRIDGISGNNSIKLMGYHAMINGGTGNDHLIADVISKSSQFNGGDGDDLLVLGGYQNSFKGGTGVNSYVVSGDVIDNVVEDIKQGDKIIFNDINWQNLWFQRSGYDLVMLTHRNVKDSSAQGKFEVMGSVTFNDYFNNNRADIIIKMGDKNIEGEREYTALSANGVDSLVQAMSGFAPNMGDSGFIDSFDNQTKSNIMTAWSDVTNGKSKLA